MVYALIGAVLIGVSLGLLGSGGSILTVPILLYLGHGDKQAIAEALGIVCAISLVGALRNARAGTVDWRAAAFFAVPGVAGSLTGAWLAHFVAGPVQIVVLGVIMLAAAISMAFWKIKDDKPPKRRHPLLMLGAGLGVGLITGFVGAGGGFVIVPALVFFAGLPLKKAIGTSLAVIAFNSAIGFVKYDQVLEQHQEPVNWQTMGMFIVLGITGTFIGSAIGSRVNHKVLRRVFAVFLVVMAIYIIAQRLPQLLRGDGGSPGVLKS